MNPKRFVIGTLVGGVTVMATGTLFFSIAPVRDFLVDAMNAGSATGVVREPQLVWAIALGALSYSALISLTIGSRSGSLNAGSGIRIGAVVGYLLWFTANFMFYGISNVGSLMSTIVDPFLELVPGAAAGGVIAVVLGKIGDFGSRRAAV